MQHSPIILTVSEITQAIKTQLEPCFRHIFVRGEISNYRLQSSGHHYFSLMEGGAQLSCVMFRTSASTLAQPIKIGDTVIVEGEISVYAPRGSYQLVVRQLSNVGLGEALLKLKALKQKLSALGWFRPERKRPLPSNIQTIGLVTSPSGAVLHDIINILTRRLGGFHLIVNPVRVQGEGAAQQIARAIHEFNAFSLVDVIIVCRGGGSAEDLAAFNEEIVAAACVQSTIPIVSAIGHETDLSITDLVCDLRAPTPSAAAELVSHERSEQREKLAKVSLSTRQAILQRLAFTKNTLNVFTKRLHQSSPQKKMELQAQRLDDLEAALFDAMRRQLSTRKLLISQTARSLRQLTPTAKLTEQRSRLSRLEKMLLDRIPYVLHARELSISQVSQLMDAKMNRHLVLAQQRYASRDWAKSLTASLLLRIKGMRQRVAAIESNLQALNPKKVLERGYAIVFRENSTQVIRSVQMTQPQDLVSIMVADGTISATVNRTNEEHRNT